MIFFNKRNLLKLVYLMFKKNWVKCFRNINNDVGIDVKIEYFLYEICWFINLWVELMVKFIILIFWFIYIVNIIGIVEIVRRE